MVLAARARPEIELHEAVSKYEFSSVSRALFAANGSLLHCQNKSKLLNILEKLPDGIEPGAGTDGMEPNENTGEVTAPTATLRAVVIDGMAILHEIPFQHGSNITCKDFHVI